MTSSPPTPPSTPALVKDEEWAELARLATDPLREPEFLDALLESVRSWLGASGVALYVDRDGALVREVTAGEAGFPHRLSDGEGLEENLEVIELPAGALAARGATRSSDPQHRALLATALSVRQLRHKVKQQGFEANLRGVELEALYDVGLAITSMLDMEELSEGILLRAVSLLDARRGALYLIRDDELHLIRTIGGDAAETVAGDDETFETLFSSGAIDAEILPDATYVQGAAIEGEGQRRGLLVVADKESRTGVGPFFEADQRTLELFANQASIALENARLHREALEKQRLEREMELAAEIQQRLLPTLVPEVSGFELLGWNRPAQEVGGDYYDLIALREGTWGLVVGDVSGKGMPAALMVSMVHSALRLLLDRHEVGPALLDRLNRHIADTSAPNKFITFFIAEVDPDNDRVQFMNAGHNPAILMRSNGDAVELATGGLPLGLLREGAFEAGDVHMESGDLLCIYSDGITEALSADDEEFGMDRLLEVLRQVSDEPLEAIVSAIDRATAEFAIGMPQADDQTLLLLRRT